MQDGVDAQMRALQMELADRQAGRTFQGGQQDKVLAFQGGLADKEHAFQGGMFDKNAGLQKDLDASATQRAFGTVDRQMAPALLAAQDEHSKYMEGANVRGLRNQFQENALKQYMAQQQAGAPSAPGAGGDDSLMFLAFGGNPGELANIKRQEMQAKLAREDSLDSRNYELGLKLLQSTNPQARALGATVMSKVKNSGIGGSDPAALQGALTPEMAPDKAIASKASLGQAFDELAALATSTSGSIDTAGGLEQIKAKMGALVKMMTDNGVPPEEAAAYIKSELGKRVPAETGLRLGRFFPGISSVGLTRRAIGYES